MITRLLAICTGEEGKPTRALSPRSRPFPLLPSSAVATHPSPPLLPAPSRPHLLPGFCRDGRSGAQPPSGSCRTAAASMPTAAALYPQPPTISPTPQVIAGPTPRVVCLRHPIPSRLPTPPPLTTAAAHQMEDPPSPPTTSTGELLVSASFDRSEESFRWRNHPLFSLNFVQTI